MIDLAGKTAIVTGAAQGIGAGIATVLSERGANVLVADYNADGAERTAEEIRTAGGKAMAVTCDVRDREQVEAAVAAAVSEFGTLDILVSNAGVTRDNLLFKMSDDDWDDVLDTHLKGAFLAARAAQRPMVKQRSGKIVLISSRGVLGNRGQANYSAAKAGLQGLARTLAIELGKFNVNVNAVAPGHVDTAMTRSVAERTGVDYQVIKDRTIEGNAIKRVGTPRDIGNAVAFLASEEAGYITGQTLFVAGRPTV